MARRASSEGEGESEGRGGGSVPDWLLLGGLAIGGYFAYKEGLLEPLIQEGENIVDDIFSKLGSPSRKKSGGTGGGGGSEQETTTETEGGTGTAAAGGSTGTCTGGPYKSTGKTIGTTQRGPTTRHYASGKADDKTIEKNAKGITFKNYQFVNYVTMTSIEHDDAISTKFGGTHMGSGWYDHGVLFKSGQGCLGKEEKHPSTQSCVVKGKSVGSVLNKKVGVAGVYFGNAGGGGKTEIWADVGSGWQMLASGNNVGGFAPKASTQEAQLRIDGWNAQPTIHCSVVQEIAAGATATSALAQIDNLFTPNAYQGVISNAEPHECGFMCSYETTSIPHMHSIQRGLLR